MSSGIGKRTGPTCGCHPMNLYDTIHLDPRCPFYSAGDPSVGNHDTRTLYHEQPDDSFTREAARLRATIEDPIREGNVALGLNALAHLVELYTTLSRGTVRERRARKEAEHKLHEIRRMITDA